MTASLPHPASPSSETQDDSFTERLRGLTHQQLLEAMTFLGWWSPGVFTAVLDYCELGDWGEDFRVPGPVPALTAD